MVNMVNINCKHEYYQGMFLVKIKSFKHEVIAESICCIKCGKLQKIIKKLTLDINYKGRKNGEY